MNAWRMTTTRPTMSRAVLVLAPVALWLAIGGVAADDSVGYVLPIGDDAPFVVTVENDGAYLGVRLEEETEYHEGGARVTRVIDDSPASRAGLEEGDIIVAFDGDVVRGPVALTQKIHEREAGDRVNLRIVRDGDKKTIEVELGDRSEMWNAYVKPLKDLDVVVPSMDPEVWEKLTDDMHNLDLGELKLDQLGQGLARLYDCDSDDEDCRSAPLFWSTKPKLGVQLVETTPELRVHLGADEETGVLVSKVLAGTPAERAGIRVGDLIVSVDGEPIENSSDLIHELADLEGETFEIRVVRDKHEQSLEVTIPAPDSDRPTGPRAWLVAPAAPPAPVACAASVPRPAPAALPRPDSIAVPAPPATPAPSVTVPAVPAPVAPAPPVRPGSDSIVGSV